MPRGNPTRKYRLAVKKGGNWLAPGMVVECSRKEAMETLKHYIKRAEAQEGFLAEFEGKILTRIRMETRFKLLEGEWP